MVIKKVGVVGCGLMGSGIAHVCAQHGYDTLVQETDEGQLQRGLGRIQKFMSKAVEKGKMSAADRDAAIGRLRGTGDLADMKDRDLVIEAIPEKMELKKEVFGALDKITPPTAILASNTSSICIVEIASVTRRSDKVCGLHFFNPVPVMGLIELVRTISTSEETFETAKAFAESLQKRTIIAKDTPGFIVNLLLVPYICDAVRALENGVGTAEDIDAGMKIGCGHPMGPLTLLDFVGLDTTLYIAEVMFAEFCDPRYAAPPLLRRLVAAGRMGRKSGHGIYKYEEKA